MKEVSENSSGDLSWDSKGVEPNEGPNSDSEEILPADVDLW